MDKHEKFEKWWSELNALWFAVQSDKELAKAAYMQGRKDAKEELDGSGTGR
jgi:hypothetical protein